MKKYKLFVKIALFIMCVFPLVMLLIYPFAGNRVSLDEIDISAFCEKFTISESLTDHIKNAFITMQMPLDGAFSTVVPVILSNSLIIYIGYLCSTVLLFLPKMAIYFLNLPFKSKVGD